MSERSLVLVKPDGVRRGLVGQILSRFEAKGFTIEAMKLQTVDKQLADQHYAEHVEKGWYPELREFITSGPLVALILSGDEAITVIRASSAPPTAARPPRAPCVGTTRCPTRRTSSTPRTRPNPRPARSPFGSRRSEQSPHPARRTTKAQFRRSIAFKWPAGLRFRR